MKSTDNKKRFEKPEAEVIRFEGDLAQVMFSQRAGGNIKSSIIAGHLLRFYFDNF